MKMINKKKKNEYKNKHEMKKTHKTKYLRKLIKCNIKNKM